jgi:uncharacterized repeat protein (TIGR04138 family)
MKNDPEHRDLIRKIAAEDGRYHEEAYHFVRRGLDFTVKEIVATGGTPRHVRGPELVSGLRSYALREFGPVSLRVLRHWGLNSTDDLGEIVFHMIDHRILGKTEEDSRDDFHALFDFEHAFLEPFRPSRS